MTNFKSLYLSPSDFNSLHDPKFKDWYILSKSQSRWLKSFSPYTCKATIMLNSNFNCQFKYSTKLQNCVRNYAENLKETVIAKPKLMKYSLRLIFCKHNPYSLWDFFSKVFASSLCRMKPISLASNKISDTTALPFS